MEPLPEHLNRINMLDLAKQCKTCKIMLKNKKRYYVSDKPKMFGEKRFTLAKICKKCGTHNYKKSTDE